MKYKSNDFKKRVLFVGSFVKVNYNGGTGGQLYASTSLISSKLSESIEWVLVDSSTKLPVPSLIIRFYKAFKRIMVCIYHIFFSKIKSLLIFSADGPSIYEKGLIALIGKIAGKKVIFAPRSGFLINDLESRITYKFIKFVFLKVDFILCQGNSWKEIFVEAYKDIEYKKFIVRPNWINVNLYTRKVYKGIKEKPILKFLFIGWVEKEKGVEELIDAIEILRDLNIKLFIAGNGTYYDEASEKISNLKLQDKIILTGWVDFNKKLDLIAECDVFILPSHYEGMPNAILEAISSGMPVIATKVGGIPDLVVNMENGILVERKNPRQIAQAIQYLYFNTSEILRMSDNSYSKARSNHSIDLAINDILELI